MDTDLTAQIGSDAQSIRWTDGAGVAGLRYYGLHAFDARGDEVPGRLALWHGGVALEIQDGDAEYPLTIDPYIEQTNLTAGEMGGNKLLGGSVAISGNTAVAGASWDTSGGISQRGSAYVFTRSGSTWTFQQKLIAADGAMNDQFGNSVAIDGDTIIVGAFEKNGSKGAAYIYTRSSGAWTLQQKITGSDPDFFDRFGSSVAIDGDTILVGAYIDDPGTGIRQGSAYIFTRSGTT